MSHVLSPYPSHYGAAFASSAIPSPPSRRLALRLTVPCNAREADGFTTFHTHAPNGLGPAYSPVATPSAVGQLSIPTRATYLLVRAFRLVGTAPSARFN